MGLSGSDIATNSAGVALMNDDLRNVGASLVLAIVSAAMAVTFTSICPVRFVVPA